MERSKFYALLDILLKRIQDERNALVDKESEGRDYCLNDTARKNGLPGWHNLGYDDTGSRFVRVWDWRKSSPDEKYGKGVTLFIEKATGIIFGAKGWAAYNPNHEYGTLETIDEWDWSDFYPRNKAGKKSLVPKALRK